VPPARALQRDSTKATPDGSKHAGREAALASKLRSDFSILVHTNMKSSQVVISSPKSLSIFARLQFLRRTDNSKELRMVSLYIIIDYIVSLALYCMTCPALSSALYRWFTMCRHGTSFEWRTSSSSCGLRVGRTCLPLLHHQEAEGKPQTTP